MYNCIILTEKDISNIKKLWKTEKDVLGIPFNKTIMELINNKSFYGIYINNELVGMCAYKIMKRNPQIRITKLCINCKYRKQGMAKFFIKTIIDKTKDINLDIIAECKDGAENNLFYNKIGNLINIEDRKTMKVRFYKIKKDL